MKILNSVLLILFCFTTGLYSQSMNVTYKTVADSSVSKGYSVSATYPQVDFGPDALMGVRGIAQDINNSIDTTVNGIIKEFISQVSGMNPEAVNGNTSSLEITSQGWVTNGSLLCTEITIFDNVAGMAHPMTTITTFNYSDNGGGPLTLTNLFKSDSQYLNFISTYCIKDLTVYAKKEGYDNINDMILSGAAADSKNFNEWSVKNDSLNIIFNPYQVAPYVFGIQRVAIPLSIMNSMIDPKGPIGYMLR